jgi:hypothetical protein
MGGSKVWQFRRVLTVVFCVSLLLLTACQTEGVDQDQKRWQARQGEPITTQRTATATQEPAATPTPIELHISAHKVASAPKTKPTPRPTPPPLGNSRPVLAFYYMWYTSSTWNGDTMSDMPTIRYTSSEDETIERQLNWAANAGITGFIGSWWGAGDQTDKNFAKLLSHAAALKKRTGYTFASSVYFECNAPALKGTANIITALRYLRDQYSENPHFFHWQGKPVIFFWDPLGDGRTLSQWASIRSQVDPGRQMIWSAEGVSTTLLDVFDGLHLFSGGYWGIKNNTMTAVDQGFRDKITAYNKANGTQKIWAAGIIPGYDDTRVPGRQGAYSIARNGGATYGTSWRAAIASNPEWITITSFNEWFEGSTIEPSMSYGDLYLTLTRQYTSLWRG